MDDYMSSDDDGYYNLDEDDEYNVDDENGDSIEMFQSHNQAGVIREVGPSIKVIFLSLLVKNFFGPFICHCCSIEEFRF